MSYHNFRKCPTESFLDGLVSKACDAGADLLKIAAVTQGPRDLALLEGFLARQKRIPLSVMGMGRLGKVSRLLFGASGSMLNYGFLDKAQVPGQWPARLLRQRLNEILEPPAHVA